MKKIFEDFLRLRYVVPLLIVLALLLAAVGEMAYQRTVSTLRYGIMLTEARVGSARILQLLTDAETSQRGYLLTNDRSYLEPLHQAEQELHSNKKVFDFIASIGPTGPSDAQKINDLTTQKFADLGRTLLMADMGDKAGALALVNQGEGQQRMEQLRAQFGAKFTEAAQMQQGARSVIYDILLFNRIAVLLLSLLMALGLYLYWLKLQQLDVERVGRQQLLEAEVAEKTAELRALAAYLQTVREDEKSHLARELHDELGGLLTAAKLNLARMRSRLALEPDMLERIEQINLHLNSGIALKRKIVEDLRPSALSALGLGIALPDMCADSSRSMGLAVHTAIHLPALPPDTELVIYRIVQEALTNIGKYAQASEVHIKLQQTGSDIFLDIKDNGCGFDVATLRPGQHGLAGMRFRVESLSGEMTLRSTPGQGVHITVHLPSPLADVASHPSP